MSLILAIESDRRQAAKVSALANACLDVELVIGDTIERAFDAIGARVPDLILKSLLLSLKDEAALAERLRRFDAAGVHIETLVIPMLRSAGADSPMLRSAGADGETTRSSGPRDRQRTSTGGTKSGDGCDPAMFGEQIAQYLERAAAERAALVAAQAELDAAWAEDAAPDSLADAGALVSADNAHESNGGGVSSGDVGESGDSDGFGDFGEFASIPIAAVRHDGVDPEPAVRSAQTDGEWEEISLDAVAKRVPPPQPNRELDAEAADLEAFVRQLESVPTGVLAPPVEDADDAVLCTADMDDQPAAVASLDVAEELTPAPSVTVEDGPAEWTTELAASLLAPAAPEDAAAERTTELAATNMMSEVEVDPVLHVAAEALVEPVLDTKGDLGGDLTLLKLLIPGESWEVVADNLGFADALCTDAEGNLYFSDMKAPAVYRVSAGDGTRTEIAREAVSGMKLAADGLLYGCQGAQHRVISFQAYL